MKLLTLVILFTLRPYPSFGFYNDKNDDNPVDFFYDNYDEEDEVNLPEEDKKQTIFYRDKQLGHQSLVIVQSISNTKKTIVIRKGEKISFPQEWRHSSPPTKLVFLLARGKSAGFIQFGKFQTQKRFFHLK